MGTWLESDYNNTGLKISDSGYIWNEYVTYLYGDSSYSEMCCYKDDAINAQNYYGDLLIMLLIN